MFPIPSGGVVCVARAHPRGAPAASAGTSVPSPVRGRKVRPTRRYECTLRPLTRCGRMPADAGRAEASALELLAQLEPALLERGRLCLELGQLRLQALQQRVVALVGGGERLVLRRDRLGELRHAPFHGCELLLGGAALGSREG